MSGSIFEEVKNSLQPRLLDVMQDLLPGGRVLGQEYVCASIQGGPGDSCRINLDTGKGSDFATGDSWGDVIGLWAKIRNIRQIEAAQELADKYGLHLDDRPQIPKNAPPSSILAPSAVFTPVLSVPDSAPTPPHIHPQLGPASGHWRYADQKGRTLAYAVRFDLPDNSKKEILPLCYGDNGNGLGWYWKALPKPRPLYGLDKLSARPEAPVLLVEGEKTADVAQTHFPDYVVLTWSGGGNAVAKADLSPLRGRIVIIWPDNDEPGFKAALALAGLLEGQAEISIVQPPDTLPEKWDLADAATPGFLPQEHISKALSFEEFRQKSEQRYPGLVPITQILEDQEDILLKEWPQFPLAACPGMPVSEFASIQHELWCLVGQVQNYGLVTMSAEAMAQWEVIYPEISQEHSGLAGSIINRAEAQTLRLALIYALLDGRKQIEERHLVAALALWSYAQESALYIFGDRTTDPLEEKILETLRQGPLTATELSASFGRNLSKERLRPVLQQLEAQQKISITRTKGTGRPKTIINLRDLKAINEINEKRGAVS